MVCMYIHNMHCMVLSTYILTYLHIIIIISLEESSACNTKFIGVHDTITTYFVFVKYGSRSRRCSLLSRVRS